jgi:hypothetical protein
MKSTRVCASRISSGRPATSPRAFAPRKSSPAAPPMRAARISATSKEVMAAATKGAACFSSPGAPTMPSTARRSASISRTIRPWRRSRRYR